MAQPDRRVPHHGGQPTGGYPAAGRNPTGEYPTTVGNPTGGLPGRGPQPHRRVPHHRGQPDRRATRLRAATRPASTPPRSATPPAATRRRRTTTTTPTPPTPTGRTSSTGSRVSAAAAPVPATTTRPSATTTPYQDRYGEGAGGPRRGQGRPRQDQEAAPPRRAAAGRLGQASPGGKRPRTLALALGTVFVVVVAAAAAYFLVLKPHSTTPNPDAGGRLPSAGASPSDQACVQQYGTYCHIELRTLDPAAAHARRALSARGQQRGQRERGHHQLVHPGDRPSWTRRAQAR